MKVEFNRPGGYGTSEVLELDAVPRVGEFVHWDGRTHTVISVTWSLNSFADDEPELNPSVRVNLDGRTPV